MFAFQIVYHRGDERVVDRIRVAVCECVPALLYGGEVLRNRREPEFVQITSIGCIEQDAVEPIEPRAE